MSARYAIYLAPAPDTALWRRACNWLARDAAEDADVAYSGPPGIATARAATMTAEVRRYGFHATIKAPFRLSEGSTADGLCDAAARFGQSHAPFTMNLALARIGAFLAFIERQPSAAIAALHADALTAFEPFRALLTEAEIARRRPADLSARQQAHLNAWGYPYVLDEFRLHFTLTGRLPVEEQPAVAALLQRHFADVLATPIAVDALCVFEQPAAGAPFRIRYRAPFAATV